MQLSVNIPEHYFVDNSALEIRHSLKLNTALIMFQEGKISIGAACEFAGIDRYTFMAACKEHNIPIVNYDIDEIEGDLQRFKKKV